MKSSATEKWIVCRICLRQSQEEMQTIFDKNSDKDLTQMILECGGVPIKQFDHYPDKICTKCLKYLRVAYKFRQTCQRSYKHLSRFIAPVVVEVDTNNAPADLTLELDDGEDIVLKLEPDEDMGIKQELSETEVDDVVDVYVPIDEDVDAIEEFQTFDRSGSGMSDEIEYLEDYKDLDEIEEEEEEEEEDFHVSDEDFIPNAKVAPKRVGRGRPPGRPRKSPSQKPSTSRSAAVGRDKKPPAKRGPKPKKLKETSFICDICGNIYPSQGRLTEHIKLHKGIKPHECEICGHCFAQTQQLARHMNTHTGNRPFKCNYCPAAFADLSTRNKHHRIHTNERPYVCDVCGKAFTYTNTLKFHKMIHTGEKPHVCDVCGKGFQQAYKLRNHKMTHEKKGVKLEKIEVETLDTYQEVSVATAQILEI